MAARGRRPIVALTDRRDAHLPFVQRHLDEPMTVIDPHALLGGGELTYEPARGGASIVVDGAPLRDVAGVWYRKPLLPRPDELPVIEEAAEYSASALKEQYAQVLTEFAGAVWISDFYAIRRASNKLHQLCTAAELGFSTLPTIFTSSPERALEFIRRHRRVVAKPIGIIHPTVNGEQRVLFTTLLDADEPPDLSTLHLAPSIFQVAPDVASERRVVVVGDRVFAARVARTRSNGVPGVYDSRVGHYDGGAQIAPAEDFPAELADRCVRLVREMGLRFGAIDMVVDAAGVHWFLENNPNGQWGYVENATGQPIGKALAELLSQTVRGAPALTR